MIEGDQEDESRHGEEDKRPVEQHHGQDAAEDPHPIRDRIELLLADSWVVLGREGCDPQFVGLRFDADLDLDVEPVGFRAEALEHLASRSVETGQVVTGIETVQRRHRLAEQDISEPVDRRRVRCIDIAFGAHEVVIFEEVDHGGDRRCGVGGVGVHDDHDLA